jgi:DNA invertase Pin-like site-specific DNA recombinase
MPTCYGYCRVSTDGQAQNGTGLDAQKDAIERYYRYKLEPLEFTWGGFFIDPAVSGSVPLFEREAGAEMDARLERGDAVLFAKLDRGFRKFADFALVFQDWRDRGIAIHLIAEGIDLSETNPIGEAMAAMMSVFAELEWDRSCERSREAMTIRKKQGKATNGYAGYGFRYVGPKAKRRRVPDEQERAVMEEIVRWREQGHSWERIYWHLLRNQIRTRKGKEWSVSRIRNCHLAALKLREAEAAVLSGHFTSPPETAASS